MNRRRRAREAKLLTRVDDDPGLSGDDADQQHVFLRASLHDVFQHVAVAPYQQMGISRKKQMSSDERIHYMLTGVQPVRRRAAKSRVVDRMN